MSSITLKYLTPICSKLFSVYKTLRVNKLGVTYCHGKPSQFKKNSLPKFYRIPSRQRTLKKSAEETENLKLPCLNKLGVTHCHGKPSQFKKNSLPIFSRIPSRKSTLKKSAEETENFKLPGLIYIQNLLKTQPNFKLRSLWQIKNNPLEWPLFDRSTQYENPINLRNLVKTRLSVDPTFLNDKELNEIQNQKYLPQRVKNLGPDLAAVHFFIDRRAAVRLTDQDYWIVGGTPVFTSTEQLIYCIRGGSIDEDRYLSGCYVKALDCSNFTYTGIRYEGLKYLTGLKHLKWLSLKNQRHINAWCLDRIAGLSGNTLEYLDISKCDLDLGCIIALSRMQALRMLVIKDPGANNEIKKALSYLKELNPFLTVKSMGVEQILCVSRVADQQTDIKVK